MELREQNWMRNSSTWSGYKYQSQLNKEKRLDILKISMHQKVFFVFSFLLKKTDITHKLILDLVPKTIGYLQPNPGIIFNNIYLL